MPAASRSATAAATSSTANAIWRNPAASGYDRRVGKRKEFDGTYAVQYKIRLVGAAVRTVVFGSHTEAQHPGIEAFRTFVVRTDDGNMMQ